MMNSLVSTNSGRVCRETFNLCMKTAIHLINECGFPADDARVTKLINCAEACYSCLNFSESGCDAHLKALEECADCCHETLTMLRQQGKSPTFLACRDQVEHCAAVCQGASEQMLSQAG